MSHRPARLAPSNHSVLVLLQSSLGLSVSLRLTISDESHTQRPKPASTPGPVNNCRTCNKLPTATDKSNATQRLTECWRSPWQFIIGRLKAKLHTHRYRKQSIRDVYASDSFMHRCLHEFYLFIRTKNRQKKKTKKIYFDILAAVTWCVLIELTRS